VTAKKCDKSFQEQEIKQESRNDELMTRQGEDNPQDNINSAIIPFY